MPSAPNCTAWNPKVIDRIVVKTDPITEKNPFTAHDHATYSSPWFVSEPTRVRPSGMNMPRQSPSGVRIATVNSTRTPSPVESSDPRMMSSSANS